MKATVKATVKATEGLASYLGERYSAATAAAYGREIGIYVSNFKEAASANHAGVVAYLGGLRLRYGTGSSGTIARILAAIKVYYAWLCFTGRRQDNPARAIVLKDRRSRDIQLQDLFSEEELERLLDRKEHHYALVHRNRALTGLLIYQGLQPRELAQLRVEDLDLLAGTVRVGATPKTNERTLSLRSTQVMVLYEYIHQIRPRLFKGPESASPAPSGRVGEGPLLIGERGNPMLREDITKHVKRSFKGLYAPRVVNCQTIRQSVIANLLQKGVDLRLVQVFAGHKWASTTERYQQSQAAALQSVLDKHHPFA